MNLEKISKCFFINLNRRKDRLDHINKTLPFYAQRYRAIDANDLELTPQIQKLFKNCINKLTKAEIACSLSHYSLWKRLVTDKDADNYLILEDDVVFKPGFQSFWNSVFSQNLPDQYSLIYLGGCQPWNKPQYHKVLKPHNQYFYNVKKNDYFSKGDHYFHMNAQSYIISKQGASLICQYIEQLGFDLEKSQAQDIFMIKFFNKNKFFKAPDSIFHLYPNISYQLHEENDNAEIDKKSDLRHAKEKFSIKHQHQQPHYKLKLIWQVDPRSVSQCFETDWIREIFSELDYDEIVDCNFNIMQDNCLIIYNDIHNKKENNSYTSKLYKYLNKASKKNNVSILHLGDEFTHARTSHYKDFKNVIRTTFNKNVSHMKNVLQIPLGYKQGFHEDC